MATCQTGRDSSARLDALTKRRRRYEGVLRALGLWEGFARMPRAIQDQFCQFKFPDPVLEFDATFPDDPAHRELRKGLEAGFRKAQISFEDSDVTVRDLFSVVAG